MYDDMLRYGAVWYADLYEFIRICTYGLHKVGCVHERSQQITVPTNYELKMLPWFCEKLTKQSMAAVVLSEYFFGAEAFDAASDGLPSHGSCRVGTSLSGRSQHFSVSFQGDEEIGQLQLDGSGCWVHTLVAFAGDPHLKSCGSQCPPRPRMPSNTS